MPILDADSNTRRGTVVVFTAVSLAMLAGFAALAIDVGYLFAIRADLQKTADASALAGATQITNRTNVLRTAQTYAEFNYPGFGTILSEPDVELGSWRLDSGSFLARTAPTNAVRVIARRSEQNDNPVELFFANLLGVSKADLQASAVALIGGARCAGIWGLEGVTGSGDISTDSYRSEDGAYGGSNLYANGDLCSNRDIELQGDVSIWGDTMYGPSFSLITSGNSYFISGDRRELCCRVEVPAFDINEIIANNDNASIGLTDRNHDPFAGSPWDLVVTGNDNLTLAGGTYYFTSVLVDGRSTLTITGPTSIYVTGVGQFTGNGLVNLTQDPRNLVIYSTGPTLNLTGTAGFYGGVVAPDSVIILEGTGEYFGSILGRMVDVYGTATVHVDESLLADLFDIDSVVPILVQ